MQLIGPALAYHDHLGRLVELGRCACGDDLELRNRIERRDFRLATLKGHLLVGDTVEGGSKTSIGVACPGADRWSDAPDGKLVLRSCALDPGSESYETHEA